MSSATNVIPVLPEQIWLDKARLQERTIVSVHTADDDSGEGDKPGVPHVRFDTKEWVSIENLHIHFELLNDAPETLVTLSDRIKTFIRDDWNKNAGTYEACNETCTFYNPEHGYEDVVCLSPNVENCHYVSGHTIVVLNELLRPDHELRDQGMLSRAASRYGSAGPMVMDFIRPDGEGDAS